LAEKHAVPTDQERRAYMLKLKSFRETLTAREQRMLDAVVLASFWPGGPEREVEGYRLLPLDSIYDDSWTMPDPDTVPWLKLLSYV
jgi:hypothetical protein